MGQLSRTGKKSQTDEAIYKIFDNSQAVRIYVGGNYRQKL
jgi:hypothetical protein